MARAERISDRIRDLSKEGLTPQKILRQLSSEGYTTTLGNIYTARSRLKKQGHEFLESQEEPSAETRSEQVDASLSPRTMKEEGARRPTTKRRYDERKTKMAQSLKNLEYKASMYPKSRVDYVFEYVPRKDPDLWENFSRKVPDRAKVREAVAEALRLLDPFEERLKTALVRGEPEPKIYDYVTEALQAWIVRFKEEKRGRFLPHEVINPICGDCDERAQRFSERLRVPEVYPGNLKELGQYMFWCRYCWEQCFYRCHRCDSELYPVKRPGVDIFDVVCSGCGSKFGLSKEIRVHPSRTREGKLFWRIFFEETVKEERYERKVKEPLLEVFGCALNQLEEWEKNPKIYLDSDALTDGLVSCGFGRGEYGITDDIVMKHFGTMVRTEGEEDDWKNYQRLSDEDYPT